MDKDPSGHPFEPLGRSKIQAASHGIRCILVHGGQQHHQYLFTWPGGSDASPGTTDTSTAVGKAEPAFHGQMDPGGLSKH